MKPLMKKKITSFIVKHLASIISINGKRQVSRKYPPPVITPSTPYPGTPLHGNQQSTHVLILENIRRRIMENASSHLPSKQYALATHCVWQVLQEKISVDK